MTVTSHIWLIPMSHESCHTLKEVIYELSRLIPNYMTYSDDMTYSDVWHDSSRCVTWHIEIIIYIEMRK